MVPSSSSLKQRPAPNDTMLMGMEWGVPDEMLGKGRERQESASLALTCPFATIDANDDFAGTLEEDCCGETGERLWTEGKDSAVVVEVRRERKRTLREADGHAALTRKSGDVRGMRWSLLLGAAAFVDSASCLFFEAPSRSFASAGVLQFDLPFWDDDEMHVLKGSDMQDETSEGGKVIFLAVCVRANLLQISMKKLCLAFPK